MLEIAAAAVAILSPYLTEAGKSFASKVGDAAFDRVATLLTAIRGKFKGDMNAEQTLAAFEEQPNDANGKLLTELLAQRAESDEAFARELQEMVENASQDRNVSTFLTQVYGEAKVGQLLNVTRAGNMSFGPVTFGDSSGHEG